MRDGFVLRYPADRARAVDGLPAGRRRVPAVHVLAGRQLRAARPLATRRDDVFERLLALRNDVGLLSEEYDPEQQRLVGNFPQAFSHVSLVNTAQNLSTPDGPAADRPDARETVSPGRSLFWPF